MQKRTNSIKTKPHPFYPYDEVPDRALVSIGRFQEQSAFEDFLDRKTKKLNEQEQNSPLKKKKKEILKDAETCCKGCHKKTALCPNLKYGRYCIDSVRAYYYMNVELYIEPLEIVARKIFIDHYNYATHFSEYRPNNL